MKTQSLAFLLTVLAAAAAARSWDPEKGVK
jgi:hypothetical protein